MVLVISISSTLYDELFQYCRSRLPEEACGFIAGIPVQGGFQAVSILPVENIAANPLQHFEMNPPDLIPILYSKERAEPLIGIFHSHPTSEAVPSLEDQSTHWSSLPSYWIVSFHGENDGVLQIFDIKKAPLTLIRKLSFVINQ